ncbi:MAG TPA: carbohydrate-binding family 9-like protein [Verrucomicrobiota bacterium]|nr:carbohydrate-binding family 9-like protein [Verrucomicrobiota bacterium]HQL79169.1 carbohydrate-binding family 9-like protein [Verrucomicrobiota bacterium]
MNYIVQATGNGGDLPAEWSAPVWAKAETLEVAHFRPESSDHRPQTSARLLYDIGGIHGMFRVQDRYVRCVRTRYHDAVWKDSCVEFFAQPRPDRGYFNFEFNCGGSFLCSHIINPERTPDGFKEFIKVPAELGQSIQARSSLSQVIDPEITTPVLWTLQFFVPFGLFEHYLGPLGAIPGQAWRGNFYKCGDETSHPHWAAWSPVDQLNFHRPDCFGSIGFA